MIRFGQLLVALLLWSAVTAARSRGFQFDEYLKQRRKADARDSAVLLMDARASKAFSAGYSAPLADLYFLKAVQYFGDREGIISGSCFPQLADILQVAVTLDPKFNSAYRFAADAIPCSTASGWVHGDRARDILVQGTQVYPDDWQLRLRLGYIYVSLLHQNKLAAEQFAAGARAPRAPAYFGPLAARLLASEGELDAAIIVTQQLLEDVESEKARTALEGRLGELYVERDLEKLNGAIHAYQQREGRAPAQLQDLVAAGLVAEIPKDPWGSDYDYDATRALATSTHSNSFKVYLK